MSEMPHEGSEAPQMSAEAAVSKVIRKFADRWPDVEFLVQEDHSILSIKTFGSEMTGEREDEIRNEILASVEADGFGIEHDVARSDWNGESQGEHYERVESYRIVQK